MDSVSVYERCGDSHDESHSLESTNDSPGLKSREYSSRCFHGRYKVEIGGLVEERQLNFSHE